MIINRGDYQIAQITGEEQIAIFYKKELIKRLPAKANLKYGELEKILDLYARTEANNEGNG